MENFNYCANSEKKNNINILKSYELDLEKSLTHKYFKREGSPGNYKYYYTEADYKAGKSSSSDEPNRPHKNTPKEELHKLADKKAGRDRMDAINELALRHEEKTGRPASMQALDRKEPKVSYDGPKKDKEPTSSDFKAEVERYKAEARKFSEIAYEAKEAGDKEKADKAMSRAKEAYKNEETARNMWSKSLEPKGGRADKINSEAEKIKNALNSGATLETMDFFNRTEYGVRYKEGGYFKITKTNYDKFIDKK